MFNQSDDTKVITFWLGLLFATFLAFIFSITEIRFLISGKDEEVVIEGTYDTTSGGRRSSRTEKKGYRFTLPGPEGEQIITALEFPTTWREPANGKLWVTYLPGSSPIKVRERGGFHFFWLMTFLVLSSILGFKVMQIVRE